MLRPPNASGNTSGYNSDLFKTDRGVRRAFMMLGYPVKKSSHKVEKKIVGQFQSDYNRCSDRFGQWGKVDDDSRLNKHTLNALEQALRWAKAQESETGNPSAALWQSLCKGYDEDFRECERPEAKPTCFVEIDADGLARVHDIGSDESLRAEVLRFEREGDVVFAVVRIPSQAGIASEIRELRCPCKVCRI